MLKQCTDMTTSVIAYIRVSTEDQTPESQKVLLESYAREHGLQIIEYCVDHAVSGYETPPHMREGFRRAIQLARQYKCPILTISLDRISRRFDDLVETLERLEKEGIEVWTIQEEWLRTLQSIADPTLRRFIYRIIIMSLGYAYQKYVESLREKTRAGLMRARAEGKHIGRPSPLHDPKKQELLKVLVCREKLPYRKVAEMLGLTINQVRYWANKLCRCD